MNNINPDPFLKILEDRNEKHSAFLKNVILSSSTILGVLVALHPTNKCDPTSHLLFVLGILLLALCILFLSIGLYAEIDALKKLATKIWDKLQDGENPNPNNELVLFSNPSKIYEISPKIGYFCFVLAVFCLFGYIAFYKEIPTDYFSPCN